MLKQFVLRSNLSASDFFGKLLGASELNFQRFAEL